MSSRLPTVLVVGGGAKALAALHALQPFLDPDGGSVVQVGWVTNTEGGKDDLEVCSHLEGPLLEAYSGSGNGSDRATAAAARPPPRLTISSAECKLLAPLGVFHQRVLRVVEPADVHYSQYYSCSLAPEQQQLSSVSARPLSATTGDNNEESTIPAATTTISTVATGIDQHRVPVDKMRPIALLSDGRAIPFDRLVSAGELADFLPPSAVLTKGAAASDVQQVFIPGLGDVSQHNPGPRWDSLNKPLYQGEKPRSGGENANLGAGALAVSQKATEVFHLLDVFDQDSLVSWLAGVQPVEFEAPKRQRNTGTSVTLSSPLSAESSVGDILYTRDPADSGGLGNTSEDDDDDESSDDESEEDGRESEEELPLLQRPHQVQVVVAAGSCGGLSAIDDNDEATATLSMPTASSSGGGVIPPAIVEYLQSGAVGPAVTSCAFCWSFIHCIRFPAAVTTLHLARSLEVGVGSADEIRSVAAIHEQQSDSTSLYEDQVQSSLTESHAATIFNLIQKYHHGDVTPHVGTEVSATALTPASRRRVLVNISTIPVTVLSLNITTVDLSAMGKAVTLETIRHLIKTFLWKGSEDEEREDEQQQRQNKKNVSAAGGPVHSMLRSLILDNVTVIGSHNSEGLRCLVTGLLKQAQYHRHCIEQCSASKAKRQGCTKPVNPFASLGGGGNESEKTEFLPGLAHLSLQSCEIRDVSSLTKYFTHQGTGLVVSSDAATIDMAVPQPPSRVQVGLTSLNLSRNPLVGTYEMSEVVGKKRKTHQCWSLDMGTLTDFLRVVPRGIKDLRMASIGLQPPSNYDDTNISLLVSKTVRDHVTALSAQIGALVLSSSKSERMLEALDLSGNPLLNDSTSLAIGEAILNSSRSQIHTLNLQNCCGMTNQGTGFLLKCLGHLDDDQLRAVLLKGSGAAGVKEVPLAAVLITRSTHLERFSLSIDYHEQLSGAFLVDQIVSGNPHKILVGLFDMEKCVEMMQFAAFGTGGNLYPAAECRPLVQVDLDFPKSASPTAASALNSKFVSTNGSPRALSPDVDEDDAGGSQGSPTTTSINPPKGSSPSGWSHHAVLRKEAQLPPQVLVALEAHLNKNRSYVAQLAQQKAILEPVRQPDNCYDQVAHLFLYHESLRRTNPFLGRLSSDGSANSSPTQESHSGLGFSGMVQPNFRRESCSTEGGSVSMDAMGLAIALDGQPTTEGQQIRMQCGLQSPAIHWTLLDEFEIALAAPKGPLEGRLKKAVILSEFTAYRHRLVTSSLGKASECAGLVDLSSRRAGGYTTAGRVALEMARCWLGAQEPPSRNADVVIRTDLKKADWETNHSSSSNNISRVSPSQKQRQRSKNNNKLNSCQLTISAAPFQSVQMSCFPFLCLSVEPAVRGMIRELCPTLQPYYQGCPVLYRRQKSTAIRPIVQWGLQMSQKVVHCRLWLACRTEHDDDEHGDSTTSVRTGITVGMAAASVNTQYYGGGSPDGPMSVSATAGTGQPISSTCNSQPAGLQELRTQIWGDLRHQLQQLLTWTYIPATIAEEQDRADDVPQEEALHIAEALQKEYYRAHRIGDIAELILQELDLTRPVVFRGQDHATMPREAFQSYVLEKAVTEREQHITQLAEHWAVLEVASAAAVVAANAARAAAAVKDARDKKKGVAAAAAGGGGGASLEKEAAVAAPTKENKKDKKGKNTSNNNNNSDADRGNGWPTTHELMISLAERNPVAQLSSSRARHQSRSNHSPSEGEVKVMEGGELSLLSPHCNPMIGLMSKESVLSESRGKLGVHSSFATPGAATLTTPKAMAAVLPPLPSDTWTCICDVLNSAQHGLLPKPVL